MPIPELSTLEGGWNSHVTPQRRVVVLFFATWSPIDGVLTASLAELAPKFEDRMIFLTADVDETEKALLQSLAIQTVPTLMIFQFGKMIESSIGFIDQEKLRTLLENWLHF